MPHVPPPGYQYSPPHVDRPTPSLPAREPVVTATTVAGLLTSVLTYAVAKGWLDATDEAFVVALIPTVAGLIAGLIARQFVTPETKALRRENDAYARGYRQAQPGPTGIERMRAGRGERAG